MVASITQVGALAPDQRSPATAAGGLDLFLMLLRQAGPGAGQSVGQGPGQIDLGFATTTETSASDTARLNFTINPAGAVATTAASAFAEPLRTGSATATLPGLLGQGAEAPPIIIPSRIAVGGAAVLSQFAAAKQAPGATDPASQSLDGAKLRAGPLALPQIGGATQALGSQEPVVVPTPASALKNEPALALTRLAPGTAGETTASIQVSVATGREVRPTGDRPQVQIDPAQTPRPTPSGPDIPNNTGKAPLATPPTQTPGTQGEPRLPNPAPLADIGTNPSEASSRGPGAATLATALAARQAKANPQGSSAANSLGAAAQNPPPGQALQRALLAKSDRASNTGGAAALADRLAAMKAGTPIDPLALGISTGGLEKSADIGLPVTDALSTQTTTAPTQSGGDSAPTSNARAAFAAPAVQLALQINRAIAAGSQNFTIRLEPAELGKIDVRLSFRRDGSVRASITAERAETLDLLQKDAGGLEKALKAIGTNPDKLDLSFSLHGGDREANAQDRETGTREASGSEIPSDLNAETEQDESAETRQSLDRLVNIVI